MGGYRCPYCVREKLVRARMAWYDYFWLLLLLRVWRCPHCYEHFRRPIV